MIHEDDPNNEDLHRAVRRLILASANLRHATESYKAAPTDYYAETVCEAWTDMRGAVDDAIAAANPLGAGARLAVPDDSERATTTREPEKT